MVTPILIKSREGFKACDEQNAINNFVYTPFWELHEMSDIETRT